MTSINMDMVDDLPPNEYFPARSAESVDTTAAGGCFSGAFAVGLSEGLNTGEAIRGASLAFWCLISTKNNERRFYGEK